MANDRLGLDDSIARAVLRRMREGARDQRPCFTLGSVIGDVSLGSRAEAARSEVKVQLRAVIAGCIWTATRGPDLTRCFPLRATAFENSISATRLRQPATPAGSSCAGTSCSGSPVRGFSSTGDP
jgi:hypothetical protein